MTTGIIIPPGEIKKLVQKTAQHVATNGSQFQKMILERQQHKTQFAFLQKENPYRAYYDHMIGEFSRKIIEQAQETERKQNQEVQNLKQEVKQEVKPEEEVVVQDENPQAAFLERVFEQLQQPDADRYTAQIPEKVTPAQISIIQLTAQYAAKNGKSFLIALSQRQKNNPQFQFLKSSSNNNKYFTSLLEAYTSILNFTPSDAQKLYKYASNPQQVLQKCRKVFEYHSAKQEQSKGKKKQEKQKKQQNIDWNDFELVDTIIFEEQLDVDSKKIESGLLKTNLAPGYARNTEEKIISQAKKNQILQTCHVCKNKILASQMTKHLKVCLRIDLPGNKQKQ